MHAQTNPATAEPNWSRRRAFGALWLRLTMVGLEFLCVIALARVFEATGYGVYAFVVALLGLLAIPATLGLDRLLVREIARLRTLGDWVTVRGLLRWSARSSVSVSLLMTLAGLLILGVWHEHMVAPVRVALAIGLVTIPLTTLARLRTGALQGLGHIRQGMLRNRSFNRPSCSCWPPGCYCCPQRCALALWPWQFTPSRCSRLSPRVPHSSGALFRAGRSRRSTPRVAASG